MRRTIVAAMLMVSLLSWNLAYPMPMRADDNKYDSDPAAKLKTATPIKHLVVIFDENNSFDHYFGTYPYALNPPGETEFHADPDTPSVNGLTHELLVNNPNALNGSGGTNPFRLDPSDASSTCDNDNHYTDEQRAFHSGLLDQFVVTSVAPVSCGAGYYFGSSDKLLGMGYYDGNTVTALWNYAQHFAMSDNFFDTEFGTTVMGHLNLISGETHGFVIDIPTTAAKTAGDFSNGSVIANVQAFYDDCAKTPLAAAAPPNIHMTGKNVGDLLTANKITWGWFYDGFALTNGSCSADYNNHYDPFNYYLSTSNQHHLPPSSTAAIGTNADQANHNYDYSDFMKALDAGNLPAVTFLKASKPNTGHPMDSTPQAEQSFFVTAINAIEASQFWKDTAIIITYDDSDGWYDHVAAPIVNPSTDPANDGITGVPASGTGGCGGPLPAGTNEDRCGFGVRLPFLVISPYAKHNYVDHSLNDTTSPLRFIEYNWGLGNVGDPQSFDVMATGTILGMFDFDHPWPPENRALFLNPNTGEVEWHY